MERTNLTDEALACLGRCPLPPAERRDLDRKLRVLWSQGRDAWPGVVVSPRAFVAHLCRGLQPTTSIALHLKAVPAADLYLATGCLAGDPRALAFFETHFLHQVPMFVAGSCATAGSIEELLQVLREKVLVGRSGKPPKLAQYTGRGPLGGWLRAVAARTAASLRRREERHRRHRTDDAAAVAPDPEASYAGAVYRAAFRTALRGALASLTNENREALRLHYLQGLTLAELGQTWRISRSKAARLVAASRQRVLRETQDELGRSLQIEAAEVASIIWRRRRTP